MGGDACPPCGEHACGQGGVGGVGGVGRVVGGVGGVGRGHGGGAPESEVCVTVGHAEDSDTQESEITSGYQLQDRVKSPPFWWSVGVLII